MTHEQFDLITIWDWGKQYGISLHDGSVHLGNANGIGTTYFSDRESLDWLKLASKWVMEQRAKQKQ